MLTAEIATPAEQAADSNLLNLLIVDDERAVRESCREVAQALGFLRQLPVRQSTASAYWIAQTWMLYCSICGCRELMIDLQAKLFRALQEKQIHPVGGTKAIPVDVRILAATNRNLEKGVQQGTFRRDLYFRLNLLTLRVPPLRERKQDIPLLTGHILERVAHHGCRAQH